MNIVTMVFIMIFFALIYILIRNELVFRIAIKWNKTVSTTRMMVIDADIDRYDSLPTYDEMGKALVAQGKLVFNPKYWLSFKEEECVANRAMYDLVKDLRREYEPI